jgi:cysteine synthase
MGGGVKDRPARCIIERGLADRTIHEHSHIVESSSGNLAMLLSSCARFRFFICITRLSITIREGDISGVV